MKRSGVKDQEFGVDGRGGGGGPIQGVDKRDVEAGPGWGEVRTKTAVDLLTICMCKKFS